jgi:hypothetical protein
MGEIIWNGFQEMKRCGQQKDVTLPKNIYPLQFTRNLAVDQDGLRKFSFSENLVKVSRFFVAPSCALPKRSDSILGENI